MVSLLLKDNPSFMMPFFLKNVMILILFSQSGCHRKDLTFIERFDLDSKVKQNLLNALNGLEETEKKIEKHIAVSQLDEEYLSMNLTVQVFQIGARFYSTDDSLWQVGANVVDVDKYAPHQMSGSELVELLNGSAITLSNDSYSAYLTKPDQQGVRFFESLVTSTKELGATKFVVQHERLIDLTRVERLPLKRFLENATIEEFLLDETDEGSQLIQIKGKISSKVRKARGDDLEGIWRIYFCPIRNVILKQEFASQPKNWKRQLDFSFSSDPTSPFPEKMEFVQEYLPDGAVENFKKTYVAKADYSFKEFSLNKSLCYASSWGLAEPLVSSKDKRSYFKKYTSIVVLALVALFFLRFFYVSRIKGR